MLPECRDLLLVNVVALDNMFCFFGCFFGLDGCDLLFLDFFEDAFELLWLVVVDFVMIPCSLCMCQVDRIVKKQYPFPLFLQLYSTVT